MAVALSDIIHLRRADGRDINYILHVNVALKERGRLMIYNPLHRPVTKTLTIPLYYTGIRDTTVVCDSDRNTAPVKLDRNYHLLLPVTIPARGCTYTFFE